VCKVYARAWDNHWTPAELAKNHLYYLETFETYRDNSPEFVRLARFFKAEPSRHPVRPCKCGAPDRWKCWSRIYSQQVLGQERAVRVEITDDWWRQTQTGAVHSDR
jgi:hypothetical protein